MSNFGLVDFGQDEHDEQDHRTSCKSCSSCQITPVESTDSELTFACSVPKLFSVLIHASDTLSSVQTLTTIDTNSERRRESVQRRGPGCSATRLLKITVALHYFVGFLLVSTNPVILTSVSSQAGFLQHHHFNFIPLVGLAVMLYAACVQMRNRVIIIAGMFLETLVAIVPLLISLSLAQNTFLCRAVFRYHEHPCGSVEPPSFCFWGRLYWRRPLC